MKKAIVIYFISYLLIGGLAFWLYPESSLFILKSNTILNIAMVQFGGLMMVLMGCLTTFFSVPSFSKSFELSFRASVLMMILLSWLWFEYNNPLFLIWEVIILIGLIPSWCLMLKDKVLIAER